MRPRCWLTLELGALTLCVSQSSILIPCCITLYTLLSTLTCFKMQAVAFREESGNQDESWTLHGFVCNWPVRKKVTLDNCSS